MAVALTLTLATACGAPVPEVRRSDAALRVEGFQHWQGLQARAAADAACGAKGVRASIYDRFDRGSGAWVYPEGCA